MEPIPGSCLCGAVRFEVTEPFTSASHCHCSRCRKESGAFGLTNARVPRHGVRILEGAELIRVWAPPDGGAVKAFCFNCGSSLFGNRWPGGDEATVRLGALDADPGIRPEYHSYVGSSASWEVVPDDGLPRYDGARSTAPTP